MMDAPYRPLKPAERELLERLLEPKFPGRDELHAQLDGLVVRELDDEGCLEFECRSGPRADVKWPAPAQGEGPDTDGLPLHVELHVTDGFISSLVMWKVGMDPPTGFPSAKGLSVFAPYSEDAGVWNTSEKFR